MVCTNDVDGHTSCTTRADCWLSLRHCPLVSALAPACPLHSLNSWSYHTLAAILTANPRCNPPAHRRRCQPHSSAAVAACLSAALMCSGSWSWPAVLQQQAQSWAGVGRITPARLPQSTSCMRRNNNAHLEAMQSDGGRVVRLSCLPSCCICADPPVCMGQKAAGKTSCLVCSCVITALEP